MANVEKLFNPKLSPLFKKISDYTDQIHWIRSADFQEQIFVSSAVESIFGITREALYKDPTLWVQAVIAEDRDIVRQHFMEWQAAANPGQVFELSYHVRHVGQDSRLISIKEYCLPMFEENTLVAFIGVSKRVPLSFEYSFANNMGELFNFFAEKSDSIFWVRDSNTQKQLYVSNAFEKIWQQSIKGVMDGSTSWYETIEKEDRPKIECMFKEPRDSNVTEIGRCRFRMRRPDGELRWIKDRSFAAKSKEGSIFAIAGIAEDITEDALREQELKKAKDLAEKANQAKSNFLALMSHELRTPLNAILGMAQILKTSELKQIQMGHVDVIIESSENLLALLNDILDINKLEVGKLTLKSEDIEVERLVHHVIGEVTPLISNKPIEVVSHLDKEVPKFIVGDEKRLLQILTNLLSNAIKYTSKGYVKLNVTCLQKNYKEATLCFTVEDSGVGIEKSKMDSVFGRFLQVESIYKRKQESLGLGLAIVKELVETMGGSIAVSSEKGIGSQFSCILPFGLQVRKATKVSGRSFVKTTSHTPVVRNWKKTNFNLKVLVIEDNQINQRVSKILLEQMGCRVDIAATAAEALKHDPNQYNLIFMDVGLPDMSGFDLVRCFREKQVAGKQTPIVAMTAHAFERDKAQCFKAGMDEIIIKPIIRDDLIATLKRWVR